MQVAIVRDAGRSEETKWHTSLEHVLSATVGQKLSPSVVIVGPVASQAATRAQE